MLACIDQPEPRAGEVADRGAGGRPEFPRRDGRDRAAPGRMRRAEPAWQRLGFECAGIVSAVGEGVDRGWIGQRVVAVTPGCFASRSLSPSTMIFAIPRRLSFALGRRGSGRLCDGALCARDACPHPGRRTGSDPCRGGRGRAGGDLHRPGAGADILATAGSEEKRSYLYRRGVEHVFDSRSLAFADDVRWQHRRPRRRCRTQFPARRLP